MANTTSRVSRLEAWRKRRGYTYQQLADELGITVGAAHNLCNGKIPRPKLAKRVFKITGITPNDFYGITGP